MADAKTSNIDPSVYLFLLLAQHYKLAKDMASCLFLEFCTSAFNSGLCPVNKLKLQELKNYFSCNQLDLKALALFSATLFLAVAAVFSAMLADTELQFLVYAASIPFIADSRPGLSAIKSF